MADTLNDRVYRNAIARLEHGRDWLERCMCSPREPQELPAIHLGTRDMEWLVAVIALLKRTGDETPHPPSKDVEQAPLPLRLRMRSNVVHLAMDRAPANDLQAILREAADAIERLRADRDAAIVDREAADEAWEDIFGDRDRDEAKAWLASLTAPETKAVVTDEMVTRFLGWKLPADFAPDGGVTFTPLNHPTAWPIGTNLLTAVQARAMLEHVLGVETDGGTP